ncbi:hydrolase [Longispora fulva]|uniref:Lysophospholipase L1-like esterase n=1 Tax=Longispora fulva TaxID=619741 RepID=A0A8J7GLZ7_9ACTN|nr:GDSL-type esterase/lipase family protein [Longispora fulva]MBG6139268.1 lysophospholipase L1-like esterase [Longispora fulva]GIG58762.1 hydrolase [Longispora fulva]
MITNPDAVTVLCYGDSNTQGERPSDYDLGRWPADVRWTGQLQDLLGDGFSVIEEGLGGRTTDVDYADRVGKNGRTYLRPCLDTHTPLDIVVLMLGTNDLKIVFDRSADQIAAAVGGLLDDIETYGVGRAGPPKVILLSPAPVDDTKPGYYADEIPRYDTASVAKSRELADRLRALAEKRGHLFADIGIVAEVGDDGVHLTRDSHSAVAALVAARISDALAR